MSSGAWLKAGALLVFLAAVAGATYGVQVALGGAQGSVAVHPEAARATINVTAGHDATYWVTLRNQGDAPLTVAARVRGEGIDARSANVTVPAEGQAAVPVTFRVPATLQPGTEELDLAVESAIGETLRQRPGHLTLRVLSQEGAGLADGDSAVVLYVGRLAETGQVFNTNDQAVTSLAFARTPEYQASQGTLTVRTSPPSVVIGFYEGILGMQAGETRTFTFPPEKGYGLATDSREVERDEALERAFDLELRTETVARGTFDDYVTRTDQGDPTSFAEGDVFRFEQGPNRWPYRIVAIDDEKVDYRLQLQPNESYTLYPFWTNASVVQEVNDTTAVFRTTPTTAANATFTMKSYWPDMSAVRSVNDTHIVVRHSPPQGFKYTQPATQFEPAREATVTEVREDAIVVTSASPNPLAGHALTFDVLMLEVRR